MERNINNRMERNTSNNDITENKRGNTTGQNTNVGTQCNEKYTIESNTICQTMIKRNTEDEI